MTAIEPFSKMLYHLSIAELFEFHASILRRTEAYVTILPRITSRYVAYKAAFIKYDDGFKKPLTEPETEALRKLDTQRKGVFILIDDDVKRNAQYAVIPERQAAAKALLPILKNYADAPNTEYAGETALYINMFQEFEKPENLVHLDRLGQTENLMAMKSINDEFQSLYNTRMQNHYEFKKEGTNRQRLNFLVGEFDKFCRVIDGLHLSASDPAEISALSEIIAIINSTIEQYTIIVHRRHSINASKKHEDKKEDSKTQTPAITKPEAPKTPPQNPDITLPEINPDNLNPPTIGTH